MIELCLISFVNTSSSVARRISVPRVDLTRLKRSRQRAQSGRREAKMSKANLGYAG
jgi:hypothetical protein